MSINFASSSYASAFEGLPSANPDLFRKQTLEYLKSFNKQKWYDEPIVSILKGEKLGTADNGDRKETVDAFGKANGMQQFATAEQVAQLGQHMATFRSPYKDLREPMRRIEAKLFDEYAGFLIGNQTLDFAKQDGITEMEEGIMANHVERSLNDMLVKDEADGRVSISRKTIYVSCVSNFTNFLDLFRKVVRSLEVGVPCAVLSRSNTAQHSFRWTELLIELMKEEGIDLGMLTFLSCTLDDIKMITKKHQAVTGNLYATCSRELAEQIISGYPNTVASTGGPNTLVSTEWTDGVKDAIRMSATIESSGQCTALRHAVVPPSLPSEELKSVFSATKTLPDPAYAVEHHMFDGVFANHKGTPEPPEESYDRIQSADAFIKINRNSLPSDDLNEYWRKVAVDFSELEAGDSDKLRDLAVWLNKHQPITLAVNAPREKVLELGKSLFEKTGLVVYTLGSTDDADVPPGLTCQARPQEAEVFGEFPPRRTLTNYTRFPVVVPSSTPSYDSNYMPCHLVEKAEMNADIPESLKPLVEAVKDPTTRGYCIELIHYLKDVCATNPKRGFGEARTALWGLQRPPILGNKTVIRCGPDTVPDAVVPLLLLFLATNAKNQVFVSIHPDNTDLSIIYGDGSVSAVQTEEEYEQRNSHAYNVVEHPAPMESFPMVGNFVSLYMPLGHIKSTKPGDEDFVAAISKSDKWLRFID